MCEMDFPCFDFGAVLSKLKKLKNQITNTKIADFKLIALHSFEFGFEFFQEFCVLSFISS
jgi:hypothetical protein